MEENIKVGIKENWTIMVKKTEIILEEGHQRVIALY